MTQNEYSEKRECYFCGGTGYSLDNKGAIAGVCQRCNGSGFHDYIPRSITRNIRRTVIEKNYQNPEAPIKTEVGALKSLPLWYQALALVLIGKGRLCTTDDLNFGEEYCDLVRS